MKSRLLTAALATGSLVGGLMLALPAYAQESHDLNTMTMDEIRDYVGTLESENASLRGQLGLSAGADVAASAGASAGADASAGSDAGAGQQDANAVHDYVKDYVGTNLSTVGYTSMGGERRDYYGDSNLELILVTPDGSYIDPEDEDDLQQYTVVSQMPAAGSEITFYYDNNGDIVNKSYNEIVLGVAKAGETADVPLTTISESTSKETQYAKDYVGRNLAEVGYTAMNGNRYDTYGTDDQRVQIVITDESGQPVDVSDPAMLENYIVTGQSPEANSEIRFVYSTNSDGEEEVTGQSVGTISLTAKITEAGQANIDQKAADEAALRESGALQELYPGTYVVGTDLEAGNYIFKQQTVSDSVNLNIYQDENAFNNSDGDWDFLWGKDDAAYYMLTDGMYVKIGDGVAISIRSDLPSADGDDLELYTGTYRVGTDIQAGNYELTPLSDSSDVYTYQSEDAYAADDGDWDFLWGKDDKGHYALQDGMVLRIKSGAVNAVRQ